MTQFAADRSSSNRAGVTLMNNQVGYVVAKVMTGKPGVEVHRPAVDDPHRRRRQVDFNYEEIAEALGWDDFGNDDFEEIMSTHYGAHGRPRRPRGAVRQPRGRGRVPRLRPPAGIGARARRHHVREGRREVLRLRQSPALLGRQPRQLGQGPGAVRQGLDRSASTPIWGWGPPRRTGRSSTSRSTRSTTSSATSSRRATSTRRCSSRPTSRIGTPTASTTSSTTRPCWTASRASSGQRPLGSA